MSSDSKECPTTAPSLKPRRSDARLERELVERLTPGLRAMLRKRIPDGLITEDLVQEALVLIVDHWRQGEINDLPQQILFSHATAVHLASNALRTEERRLRLIADYTRLPHADSAPGPEVSMMRKDLLDAIRDAVQSLPNARDRIILLRYYVGEESKASICQDLALDPRHFDRVLHRARTRLRELVSRDALSGETSTARMTLMKQRDLE